MFDADGRATLSPSLAGVDGPSSVAEVRSPGEQVAAAAAQTAGEIHGRAPDSKKPR